MYLGLLTLPLACFLACALFGRYIGARGAILLCALCSCCCAAMGLVIFYEVALCACPCQISCAPYFQCAFMDASWGFLFDTLTAVMTGVVTLISCCVVLYSCSYMIQDPHFIRFLSFLELFTLCMLILVTADNYVLLFVGWELVGLASFLLISFWFTRLQASKAAIQAMMLNRIGDIGLALGILCLYFCYKTTNFQALYCVNSAVFNTCLHSSQDFEGVTIFGLNLIEISCILLFIGAMGKSGQFGLHAWLPNAMNAPTPVSALLHAATMVTAGIFLLARSSPLFEFAPFACAVVTCVGAMTALYAGSVGLVQNDFKGIIAYSTCSQLGYMVTICGLSGYNVGIFHLFNHAFFKALLFLTAGAVIHATANMQDVRKFGSLQQILIFSYVCLLTSSLALVGAPFLTGFYSKDVILELACCRYSLSANFSYVLTCFSVFTTSYYSFRLLNMVFFDTASKTTNANKNHVTSCADADNIMIYVLSFLACGSIYAGWLFKDMFLGFGSDFWNNSLFMGPGVTNGVVPNVEAEFLQPSLKLLPLVLTCAGALVSGLSSLAYVRYAYNVALSLRPLYIFLSLRWFYDKLLNQAFGFPAYALGFSFVTIFDKGLLELLPIFGLALPRGLKNISVKLNASPSGLIYHYATLMIFTSLLALAILSLHYDTAMPELRLTLLMAACLLAC